MAILRTPWLAGNDCNNVESTPAIPVSFSVTMAENVTQTAGGTTYTSVASGTATATRVTWSLTNTGMAANTIGLGRTECGCPGPVLKQVPPTATGIASGTVSRTETVDDGINPPVVTATTPPFHLYLFTTTDVANVDLVDALIEANQYIGTGGGGGTLGTVISANAYTWAELVGTHVVNGTPPTGYTGTIVYTFTIT